VAAVAVWAHAPTARELLEARLADGWRSTPSALKEGERVLGYAACVVTGEHRRR
jgi:hypothetical protein